MKLYKTALFLFHRDLRLADNTGLRECLKAAEQVLPVFIFEKKQLERNSYKSSNALQFMLESLQELEQELQKKQAKLIFRYGDTQEELQKLLSDNDIEAVYFNRDYTPFAINRDKNIKALCEKMSIACKQFGDALLHEPEEITKTDGLPYTVYTPFMKAARKLSVRKPKQNRFTNYVTKATTKSLAYYRKQINIKDNPLLYTHGGRSIALQQLSAITSLKNYKDQRDFPANQATTGLSAHNKFGTISIRELYWKVRNEFSEHHQLVNELYWRDFYTHIAYHFPHVFKTAYKKKYQQLHWSTNAVTFSKWKEGKTGFPIVDAGMRQLQTTGYMHNRVRMIVASFLTKDLHISWQKGEKYFAQQLVDYDPCVNNGSWQWAASTGTDAQPYFRVFNPWLQQKKFDPDCVYIKQWIPELANYTPKEIHHLATTIPEGLKDYPQPIVNHKHEREIAIAMFN